MVRNTGIKVISQNVRGLANFKKQRQLFYWLHKQKIDIALLQETHSTAKTERFWSSEWGYTIHFCHGTSDSRGVCILYNNTFELMVHCINPCSQGRLLFTDISINGTRLILCNVYGPNQYDYNFFENMFITLCNYDCSNLIFGGDFNLVLDLEKDKFGGRKMTHTRACNTVKQYI